MIGRRLDELINTRFRRLLCLQISSQSMQDSIFSYNFWQQIGSSGLSKVPTCSNMFQPSSPTSPAVPGTSWPQLASAPATPRRRAASAGSATRGRGLPGVVQALRPSAPTAAGSDCCRTSAPRLLRGRKWS